MSDAPDNSRSTACPQCGASLTLPDYADLAVCSFCGANLRRIQPVRVDEWGPLRRELEDEDAIPDKGTAAQAAAAPDGPDLTGQAGEPAPAAEGPALPAEERVIRALSCPQCAGPLSVRAGRRILLCAHCGVRVLVRGENGLSRWLFPQNVTRPQAMAVAARWLAEFPGIARRARRTPMSHARLVHVPIWEHRALVAGWEYGSKLRTRYHLVGDEEGQERLDLDLVEESFEDPHLTERRFYRPACDLASLGATRPRFSGRELLLPLVAGEVDPFSTVMEPQGTAAEVAEQARKFALRPASGELGSETHLAILRESLTLLYYPLWLVDYQAGGRSYRIVVDAREGTVNSAGAPGGESKINPSLGLRIAALVAVAIFALWLGSLWEGARVPTVFAAVIVCIAAILLALKSPGGGKVEYHEPFSS